MKKQTAEKKRKKTKKGQEAIVIDPETFRVMFTTIFETSVKISEELALREKELLLLKDSIFKINNAANDRYNVLIELKTSFDDKIKELTKKIEGFPKKIKTIETDFWHTHKEILDIMEGRKPSFILTKVKELRDEVYKWNDTKKVFEALPKGGD